ncbi:MAG: hypothetical protein LBI87_12455, partial [Candidatus Accumulibacter sp.]|nr:hypothetical protein [Accumulibacter sp.]
RKPVDVAERIGRAGRLGLSNGQIGKCHDSSPELSQVWIFDSSDVPFQQESGTRNPRNDGLENGLKSPGCGWISVASGRIEKYGNPYFSNHYGRQWMSLV